MAQSVNIFHIRKSFDISKTNIEFVFYTTNIILK